MTPATSPSEPPAPPPRPDSVVVLAVDAEVGSATSALFDLVRRLRASGQGVEVVLARHGALLQDLRAICPVKVVDDLSRSPLDRVLRLVRLGTVGGALKGRRVRHWLRRASGPGSVAVVLGLEAARLARQLPASAAVLVAANSGDEPASLPEAVWGPLVRRTARFLAPDATTGDGLVAAGVPADRVTLAEPAGVAGPTDRTVGTGEAATPATPGRVHLVALDAQRSSDNYVLLSILRWLRDAGIDTELLLWRHGPLLDEMRSLCRVRVVDDLTRSPLDRVLRMVGLKMVANRVTGLRLRRWMWNASRRAPSLWVRGLAAARIVRSTPLDARVVVQVADGEAVGADALGGRDWELVLARVGGFVVPGERTREALIAAGVAADRIRAQDDLAEVRAALSGPEDAPVHAAPDPPLDEATRRRRRAELGIPDDAVLIGSTGTHDWWKAPEPIVAFAWALRRRLPDRAVHLVWLCHDLSDEDGLWPLRHDIDNAGLADVFHVVEADTLFSQLGLCDLLVLAGRPDSFAMIRAEIAMWARPVVCYRNGVTEAALDDAALPVDYLDIEGLAAAVAELLDDPVRLDELARHAETMRQNDFEADLPRWLATLTSLDEAVWVPRSSERDRQAALVAFVGGSG